MPFAQGSVVRAGALRGYDAQAVLNRITFCQAHLRVMREGRSESATPVPVVARTHAYPGLDALRALAAISVVIFHVALARGAEDDGYVGDLLSQFTYGVTLFFVLSGFLLYGPFVAAMLDRRRHVNVSAYLSRRVVRIVPAYWLALTALAIWPGVNGDVFGSQAPTFYGFAQIYDAVTFLQGLPQAWTLCVELTFYLALPPLAVFVGRRPVRSPNVWLARQLTLLGVAAISANLVRVAVAAAGADFYGGHFWISSTLLGTFDWFAAGMALAAIVAARRHGATVGASFDRLAADHRNLCWLAAGGLLCAMALARPQPHSELANHVLAVIAAILIVAPIVLGQDADRRKGRALPHRFVIWLGIVSWVRLV